MAKIEISGIAFILVWVFLILTVASFALESVPGMLASTILLFFFALVFAIPNVREEE